MYDEPYDGDQWAEHLDYEANARYDYIREAYGDPNDVDPYFFEDDPEFIPYDCPISMLAYNLHKVAVDFRVKWDMAVMRFTEALCFVKDDIPF